MARKAKRTAQKRKKLSRNELKSVKPLRIGVTPPAPSPLPVPYPN